MPVGMSELLPASMTGLPLSGIIVSVGPPLLAKLPSLGFKRLLVLPSRLWFVVLKPPEPSPIRLLEPAKLPDRSEGVVLLVIVSWATMQLLIEPVPLRTCTPAPGLLEVLLTIVQSLTESVPAMLWPPPPGPFVELFCVIVSLIRFKAAP